MVGTVSPATDFTEKKFDALEVLHRKHELDMVASR